MPRHTLAGFMLLAALALAWFCASVAAQEVASQASPPAAAPLTMDAKPLRVNSAIDAVTLYRGRASITRSASLSLDPGVYDLRFTGLPGSIQPQSIQARASGSGNVKVLAVEYAERLDPEMTSTQAAALDAEIESLQQNLKEIAGQRSVIQAQQALIAAVGVRTTNEASAVGGTEQLDLDVIRKQLAFIAEESSKLLEDLAALDAKQRELEKKLQAAQSRRQAIGGEAAVDRSAFVTVVASEPTNCTIELIYLVADATWEPAYNVRKTTANETSAQIEYDAVLTQRTGEDWPNVRLTLSTAQPTLAANPPMIEPWFVDVLQARVPAAVAAPPARYGFEATDEDQFKMEQLAADAAIAGSGPAVSFELPRAVTVRSDSQKQQRTRIATLDAPSKFVHVAVPLLTDAVYLRGEMTNASGYQLLPGRAAIFVDQSYVGPTTLDAVAPGGAFKVHFGIDPAIRIDRKLVSKHTENTGLLSGGRRTNYRYRFTIDNGTGKPIVLELWDRYPVSRTAAIQIELVDLSTPLATDAYYTTQERPQGLLKWVLNIPSGASGAAAYTLSYGVRIDRAKDIEMTPLPE